MEQRAFRLATAIATGLQLAMVGVGVVYPVLERDNLYPIFGTILAVLAGWLFARWAPGPALKPALVGGALAGGISSLLGVLFATLLQVSTLSPLTTILIATVTGAVAGAVGGFFGRLFGPRPARR